MSGDSLPCSGYFDSIGKKLLVATSRDDWALILAHEYGHMQQWKEGKFEKDDGAFEKFDDWLLHKIELDDKELLRCIRFIQACELDAEKRAVEFIRKYDLSKDIKGYRQRANAYVLFYEIVRRYRKWCNRESPYKVDAAIKLMPTHFIRSLGVVSKRFVTVVRTKCL